MKTESVEVGKRKEWKIGDIFVPFDNSWCINLLTKEKAHLLKQNVPFVDEIEKCSTFVVIKEPYILSVNTGQYNINRYFVDIQSNVTNNIYRHLAWWEWLI